MYKIFIILVLIFDIKNEIWNSEVNGHDINDSINGYTKTIYPISDFYLCSERKYRVHFTNGKWSDEFTACQPAGEDIQIDGISISGGLKYGGEIASGWLENSTGYINDNETGYVGIFGKPLYSVFISGDEYYRIACETYDNSYEKSVAARVIKNFFDKIYNEDQKDIYRDNNINITISFINIKDINYGGKITMKIENDEIIYKSYNNSISHSLNQILKEAINLDIKDIESIFENDLSKNGLHNGNVAINFKWA